MSNPFGRRNPGCYDNKPGVEWWERKFGRVLTGNSGVWWVNIESAESHLGHRRTSPAQRSSVLTVNKDILPTFCGINTGLWKQTAARPPHPPALTAPCEGTLEKNETRSDTTASLSIRACGISTSLGKDGRHAEPSTLWAQEAHVRFVLLCLIRNNTAKWYTGLAFISTQKWLSVFRVPTNPKVAGSAPALFNYTTKSDLETKI